MQKGIGVAATTGSLSKVIEDIQSGDLVWAWNESTGEVLMRPVKRLFRHEGKPILAVAIADPDGGTQEIEATTEHPFWIEGRGWVAAGELRSGDILKRIDACAAMSVLSVKSAGKADVFNFEVDELHNYFVGLRGVLVHNASKDPSASNGAGARSDEALPQGGATMPVTSFEVVPHIEVGVFHAPATVSANDWNHMTPEMSRLTRFLAAQSLDMVPTDYSGTVRHSNGQSTSTLITGLDISPHFKGGNGTQKVFRVLDGGNGRSHRMGIAMNSENSHPVNILYEVTLNRISRQYKPVHKIEQVLPVSIPRKVGKEYVFDDISRSKIGLGMVMRVAPNAPMLKAKKLLEPLSWIKDGTLHSHLEGLPGWDLFGTSRPMNVAAGAIAGAVSFGDLEPIRKAWMPHLDTIVSHYWLDEGARPLVEATRWMTNEVGIATLDFQGLPMHKHEWINPRTGKISIVNFGEIDQGGLIYSGQEHPLSAAVMIEGIPPDYEHTALYDNLTAQLMDDMIAHTSGHRRTPERVFSFGSEIDPVTMPWRP